MSVHGCLDRLEEKVNVFVHLEIIKMLRITLNHAIFKENAGGCRHDGQKCTDRIEYARARAHTHTHARTHTHTHARTHARTHAQTLAKCR